MGFLHVVTQCESEYMGGYNNEEEDSGLDVDYKGINSIVKSTAEAFLTGDSEEIASLMLDESLEYYGDRLNSQDPDELKELGNALNDRELVVASEVYAEYRYEHGGKSYSICFARLDKGDWKLMRY